jgi:hypothetical protein
LKKQLDNAEGEEKDKYQALYDDANARYYEYVNEIADLQNDLKVLEIQAGKTSSALGNVSKNSLPPESTLTDNEVKFDDGIDKKADTKLDTTSNGVADKVRYDISAKELTLRKELNKAILLDDEERYKKEYELLENFNKEKLDLLNKAILEETNLDEVLRLRVEKADLEIEIERDKNEELARLRNKDKQDEETRERTRLSRMQQAVQGVSSLMGSLADIYESGDDVTEEAREVDLVLGNNNVNGENITFVYTADNAVKLEIAVGNYVMNNVDVTYSVNGGTAIAIAQASSVKVDLNQGDVLKIFATTKGGYVSINASKVVIPTIEMDGTGAENDPYIIPSIPYEFSFNGKHDVYVQFTAEKAGTYILTYAQGCYVTGMPSSAIKDSANFTYTFDMEAGETLKFNPWKTSGSDV